MLLLNPSRFKLPGAALSGVFISTAEVNNLASSGTAYDNVLAEANTFTAANTEYDNQDSRDAGLAYASALMWIKTGTTSYRSNVRDAISTISGAAYDKANLSALGWARNMPLWIIAADVIDLASYDPTVESAWQTFLSGMPLEPYSGDGGTSLQNLAEKRPNNIGVHARSACIAIARYTGNTTKLELMKDLHYAWIAGTSSAYPAGTETGETGFSWGTDKTWHCDPATASTYLGVNAQGCTRDGHNFDGIIPDDYRRNGSYDSTNFPGPSTTDYPWEVMGGISVTTELLRRAGYSEAVGWGNNAVERALTRLKYLYDNHSVDGWEYAPSATTTNGDDRSIPYLVNFLYGSAFPAPGLAYIGRGHAFGDYTHAGRTA